MLRSGLVSVTFRKLTPFDVLNLVSEADLEGIEWGGDIHVPPGNSLLARQIGKQTIEAGIKVAAYGSYYRVGAAGQTPFQVILETAQELGAPTIRVWAGVKGSAEAAGQDWQVVIEDAQMIAAQAAKAGITLSFEFHDQTLNDTSRTCKQLLNQIQAANVKTLWQPPVSAPFQECLEGLATILPWLSNVHVFFWNPGYTRRPLAEGKADWLRYIETIKNAAPTNNGDRFLMLEFVRNDAPDSFYEDTRELKEWIRHARLI